MKPNHSSKAQALRLWHELLEKFSAGPDTKLGPWDAYCLLTIFISLCVGMAASWQRWGNPLVDSGRELNVPLRLLHGEQLYSQVNYIYGPLSPYLNALLYWIFRPSLWVIWAHGFLVTVLILGLTFWIARQITGRLPSTIACIAVTWLCALKPQGNYLLAYSFGGLDGCFFVLLATALLIQAIRKKNSSFFLYAGIATAFAILAKTEFGATALATGIVAGLLAGFPQSRLIFLNWLSFLAPALVIPALVFWRFAAQAGWPALLVDNHIFFGHVPWQLVYFNGVRFGFGHPWQSVGLILASLLRLLAVAGILAFGFRLFEKWRKPTPEPESTRNTAAIVGLAISVLAFFMTGRWLSDIGPFLPMPVLLALPIVGGTVSFLKSEKGDASARTESSVLTVVSCCAFFSLARILLRVSTGGALSSFLLPASIIVFVYLWVDIFPLTIPSAARRYATRLVSALLLVSLAATAVTISMRYRRKFSFAIHSEKGTWFTTPDLGVPFAEAVHFIDSKSQLQEPVAVIPEGSSLLFLSGRRNPLRDEIITPGFLNEKGEKEAIGVLAQSRAPLIFIANRLTPEFRQARFGIDYDERLMKWIEIAYVPCGTFSARPGRNLQIGESQFFLRAYCRDASRTSLENGSN